MANHPSALKRAKQNRVRRLRNRGYKSRAKTAVKEVRTTVAENDPGKALQSFKEAVSILQKTAGRGVIHKNTAARKISRLARQVNQIQAS